MKELKLPRIYPITNVELFGMTHSEQVRALAEAGCRFVQIREKSASSREFFEEVSESLKIACEFGMKLIVNDRVDVAIAAGAHGVHLGQSDLPPLDARRLMGDEAIIGFSTHSVDQAVQAMRSAVDYIAIGPIFQTGTKPDPDPRVGLNGLIEVRKAIGDFPLVAIGGISRAHIREVLAAGADSAAVISGLVETGPDIGSGFAHLNDTAGFNID